LEAKVYETSDGKGAVGEDINNQLNKVEGTEYPAALKAEEAKI